MKSHETAIHMGYPGSLIAELRRIGNNLNQLARLGHIQNRKHGGTKPSDNAITAEAMQQLAKLEAVVTKFDDGVTFRVRPKTKMIIKSMSRKEPTFGQSAEYIARGSSAQTGIIQPPE